MARKGETKICMCFFIDLIIAGSDFYLVLLQISASYSANLGNFDKKLSNDEINGLNTPSQILAKKGSDFCLLCYKFLLLTVLI